MEALLQTNIEHYGLSEMMERDYWGHDTSPGQYFRFVFLVQWRCASNGLQTMIT